MYIPIWSIFTILGEWTVKLLNLSMIQSKKPYLLKSWNGSKISHFRHKFVFLGNANTGKTSIISRFMYDSYDPNYQVKSNLFIYYSQQLELILFQKLVILENVPCVFNYGIQLVKSMNNYNNYWKDDFEVLFLPMYEIQQ